MFSSNYEEKKMNRIWTLVTIMTVCVFFISHSDAYGITKPMTTEQVLKNFDLIVLATVIVAGDPEDGKPLEFQIGVEEIIKKPDSISDGVKTIDMIGCTPNKRMSGFSCPYYDEGERGLFLISISDKGYEVSSRSQTSKMDCTSNQFLENYAGIGMGLSLNPSEERGYNMKKYHFTGEPVNLYYTVMNQDMKQNDYSVKFNARTGGDVFSDVVNGTISECSRQATVTTTFVPTVMGTYGFFAGPNDDTGAGMGFFGTPIVDFGASPKKQQNAGIHGQDVWCKPGLVLILKNDITPNRMYDNSSACMTPDTAEKISQRNWGFALP